MQIRVRIGTDERDAAQADPSWMNAQLARCQAAGELPRIKVIIAAEGVRLGLRTPIRGLCDQGRVPNKRELDVIDVWQRHGLSTPGFAASEVVAFVREVRRMIR